MLSCEGDYSSHHLVKRSRGKPQRISSSGDEVIWESLKATKRRCRSVPRIPDCLSQSSLSRFWRRLQLPARSPRMQTQPQNLGKLWTCSFLTHLSNVLENCNYPLGQSHCRVLSLWTSISQLFLTQGAPERTRVASAVLVSAFPAADSRTVLPVSVTAVTVGNTPLTQRLTCPGFWFLTAED